MATIGSIIQSQFIGCPISVPVTAASPSGNITFHRVRLKLEIWDVNGGTTGLPTSSNKVEFEFSSPCSNSETIWFDVSSALRAFVDSYLPSPTTFVYPSVSASMQAMDDYMKDGISYEGQEASSIETISGKHLGTLTDLERGAGITGSYQEPARYGRKPTSSPEICYYDENHTKVHLQPGSTASAPSVSSVTIPTGSPTGQNPSNIYGIRYPVYGHEIRFVNSLGVHENIFAAGLPTKEVNYTTEKYTIARQETLTRFSRGLAVKQNDYETWTFSSGPLDEQWTSWYIHEFLMVRWAWIDVNGIWIPCHVLPDETITLVSREKAEIMEVKFKLQMDINGSPCW